MTNAANKADANANSGVGGPMARGRAMAGMMMAGQGWVSGMKAGDRRRRRAGGGQAGRRRAIRRGDQEAGARAQARQAWGGRAGDGREDQATRPGQAGDRRPGGDDDRRQAIGGER